MSYAPSTSVEIGLNEAELLELALLEEYAEIGTIKPTSGFRRN